MPVILYIYCVYLRIVEIRKRLELANLWLMKRFFKTPPFIKVDYLLVQ